MSIFKTSWILLKIKQIKENEFLLDVFSYDYWKIKLKIKKNKSQKSLDIWFIINFEINTKKENDIHQIKNIKIKNEFDYINKSYEIIIEYLELLSIINEKCPLNLPIFEIFNILNELHNLKNITSEKIIFAKLKVFAILWILDTQIQDEKIKKILSFISKESIKNIFKLKWLNDNEKNILKNILTSYKN